MGRVGILWGLAAVAAFTGGACRDKTEANQPPAAVAEAAEDTEAADHPAPTTASAPAPLALPWIEDDYPAALARAQREKKPIVVDLWAAWCHTCLAMKHGVLADPGFAAFADRFVWLSLDTENPANEPAIAKLPLQVWPTFYVVSPAGESVQARHEGAASAAQFRALLTAGERGHLDALRDSGELAANAPGALVRDASRAAMAGDWARAADIYGRALAAAAADWPRTADTLVARAHALYRAEAYSPCVDLGLSSLGDTGASASAADFAGWTSNCASQLEPTDERVGKLRAALTRRLEVLIGNSEAPLSVDDRADAMRILRELYDATGHSDQARAIAQQQRSLLDRAASEAATPYEVMTYHWPRSEVYVYLGIGEQLLADLRASEKALPREYDPPYRLAWLLHQLGRNDEALAAVNRALAKMNGPRKERALALLADIKKAQKAAGEQAAAGAPNKR